MLLVKYNMPHLAIDDTQEAKDSSQAADNKSRCKLAAAIRLADVRGWSTHIYNNISHRCSQVPTQFYTNPFGLLFCEVTASKIVKLDSNGNIVQHGLTDFGYNLPAFYLTSAIYQARSDVNCIVFLHEPILAGIAATKQGFLPLSVEGLACSDISYYDYEGSFDSSMVDNLVKSLGDKNKILVLRNHGVAICGTTLEETFFYTNLLVEAAATQIVASATINDVKDLILLPMTDIVNRDKVNQCYSRMNAQASDNILWKPGELEFEAEMRRLDHMGFKTGYPYKKKFFVSSV